MPRSPARGVLAASAHDDFVAIDFGTSNSAVALPRSDGGVPTVRLVELDPGHPTMPTAVFYRADTPAHQHEADRLYGRAALAAYVEGVDGRLMRSMKSILGSSLLDQSTDIGAGRSVRYRDVVTGYLRRLKTLAEAACGHPLRRVVLGRPVFFVDDDPARDAQAQAALLAAAQQAGFADVQFQFEPIAAALDHESKITREQLVLVADIGGGTSDFCLVRVGPERAQRARRANRSQSAQRADGSAGRRDDILAHHGVHLAGTDFDRHVELQAILPLLGYRTLRPGRPGQAAAREVPSGVYFDLATWHLINTVYSPARLAELRSIKSWYADPRHYTRLITTVQERLGHALAAAAEQAKIDVALHGSAQIDLSVVEGGLATTLLEAQAARSIEADLERIVQAARQTARIAGVQADAVDALYFTGGSTGLQPLVDRIAASFPGAEVVRGDRFASVAQGLGLHAREVFRG